MSWYRAFGFIVIVSVVPILFFAALDTQPVLSMFGVPFKSSPVTLQGVTPEDKSKAFLRGQLRHHEFSQAALNKTVSIDLEGEDVLVFLHIQKTGGTTFEHRLVHDLVVQPPCVCYAGRKKCTCLTSNGRQWLFDRNSPGWVCGLHADWTTLNGCMEDWFIAHDVPSRKHRRYHFMTYIRNPVDRFVSEWLHVRRGATWKNARHVCGGRVVPRNQLPLCFEGENWAGVSLEEFMACKHNLAFNRMTRMLANLTQVNCFNRTGLTEAWVQRTLLASAKVNLQNKDFFGLTDEPAKSQFLFELTFGLSFRSPFQLKNQTHVGDMEMSRVMRKRIALANKLDAHLYLFARDLFSQRVKVMERQMGFTVEEYFSRKHKTNNSTK